MKREPQNNSVDSRSEAQILLGIHLRELGFQQICYEYYFYSERKWHSDIFLPEVSLLIECDGGLSAYTDKNGVFHPAGAGHKRGKALEDDYLKQNVAQMLGYKILRFSNRQVKCGAARAFIKDWMSRQ